MKQFLLKFFTWWNGQTFGTQLWTSRYGELVGEDGLRVVQEAADEGGLAIINGTGGAQAQGIALLESADVRREGRGHQK